MALEIYKNEQQEARIRTEVERLKNQTPLEKMMASAERLKVTEQGLKNALEGAVSQMDAFPPFSHGKTKELHAETLNFLKRFHSFVSTMKN